MDTPWASLGHSRASLGHPRAALGHPIGHPLGTIGHKLANTPKNHLFGLLFGTLLGTGAYVIRPRLRSPNTHLALIPDTCFFGLEKLPLFFKTRNPGDARGGIVKVRGEHGGDSHPRGTPGAPLGHSWGQGSKKCKTTTIFSYLCGLFSGRVHMQSDRACVVQTHI